MRDKEIGQAQLFWNFFEQALRLAHALIRPRLKLAHPRNQVPSQGTAIWYVLMHHQKTHVDSGSSVLQKSDFMNHLWTSSIFFIFRRVIVKDLQEMIDVNCCTLIQARCRVLENHLDTTNCLMIFARFFPLILWPSKMISPLLVLFKNQ